jgi:hypothetical protein
MRAQLSAAPSVSLPSVADNAEIPAAADVSAYEAGVSSHHAGGTLASSRPGPRWLWHSGSHEGTARWTEYSPETSATIEEAFASGFEAVWSHAVVRRLAQTVGVLRPGGGSPLGLASDQLF